MSSIPGSEEIAQCKEESEKLLRSIEIEMTTTCECEHQYKLH